MFDTKVVALCGGIGGAKLALGLSQILPEDRLTIIGNTGDDINLYGLHISPDLDIVMYTLAGIVDQSKGWGMKDETFNFLKTASSLYGSEDWFNIGDRDLATHIIRTQLLKQGKKLSEITELLCKQLGLDSLSLIPMTDDRVTTYVEIADGTRLHFEEYFVKRGFKNEVKSVDYHGCESARAANGTIDALERADVVVICPSNPVASVGPILSVGEIRKCIEELDVPVVSVSPLIGGRPVKGPTDKFLQGLGLEVSSTGVAEFYDGLVSHMILDLSDKAITGNITEMGIKTMITTTLMRSLEDKVALARKVIDFTG